MTGAQAAASHTGALAGSEAVYDAIFKQTGIIRAESIHELLDFASAFSYWYAFRLLLHGDRGALATFPSLRSGGKRGTLPPARFYHSVSREDTSWN